MSSNLLSKAQILSYVKSWFFLRFAFLFTQLWTAKHPFVLCWMCAFPKQWPLAPNSQEWRITRANVARRVTFFSKMAFGECLRVWRVLGKWFGKCWRVWRVRVTRLGECWRVWRVRATRLGECWRVWRVRATRLGNVGESGESAQHGSAQAGMIR